MAPVIAQRNTALFVHLIGVFVGIFCVILASGIATRQNPEDFASLPAFWFFAVVGIAGMAVNSAKLVQLLRR